MLEYVIDLGKVMLGVLIVYSLGISMGMYLYKRTLKDRMNDLIDTGVDYLEKAEEVERKRQETLDRFNKLQERKKKESERYRNRVSGISGEFVREEERHGKDYMIIMTDEGREYCGPYYEFERIVKVTLKKRSD